MKGLLPNTKICLSAIYIIGVFLVCTGAQARTKELQVNITGADKFPNDNLSYSIYRGRTKICTIPIDKKHTFSKSHFVECGNFTIQIFKNDSLFQTYDDVVVDCRMNTKFYIRLDNQTSYSIIDNTSRNNTTTKKGSTASETPISFNYGSGFIEEDNYPIKNYFRIGSGINYRKFLGKYLSVGGINTATISLSFPKHGEMLIDSVPQSHERYIYSSIDFGFFLRLCAFNQLKKEKGFSLDIGATYHFPLLFRHISVYSNHKNITRYIHRFNDVEIFARIRKEFFCLFGGYRLLDFVKFDYPQNPKLIFGFEFTIPID